MWECSQLAVERGRRWNDAGASQPPPRQFSQIPQASQALIGLLSSPLPLRLRKMASAQRRRRSERARRREGSQGQEAIRQPKLTPEVKCFAWQTERLKCIGILLCLREKQIASQSHARQCVWCDTHSSKLHVSDQRAKLQTFHLRALTLLVVVG